MIYQDIRYILEEICRQDERIEGVFFRRLSDDTQFLYLQEDQSLEQGNYLPAVFETAKGAGRSLIGAGIFKQPVFGIQSGIISRKYDQEICEFQLTVLYDLERFDDMISEHASDTEARFWITTTDGLILYDSYGAYGAGEEVFYKDMAEITGSSGSFTNEEGSYAMGVREKRGREWIAFYTIPQKHLIQFRADNMVYMTVLFTIILIMVVFFIMLFFNMQFGRRFLELEKGMDQIGNNNLKYRLQVRRQEDEFTRIALRFNRMCDRLEDSFQKNRTYQILQQNAEYRALQTSVNPHFLYNSLEAVRENLERAGQKDSAEMILLMARIFEYQIRGEGVVTIQKEKRALQNYIDFSGIRFRYSFEYSIDFSNDILKCVVPKLIFQPIMENYFTHGMRQDGTDCIRIMGYQDEKDGMIHICFCDNGKGMTQEEITKLGASLDESIDVAHMGLHNVHNRLRILFDNSSRVEIFSNAPKPGISVCLVFQRMLKSAFQDSAGSEREEM